MTDKTELLSVEEEARVDLTIMHYEEMVRMFSRIQKNAMQVQRGVDADEIKKMAEGFRDENYLQEATALFTAAAAIRGK